MMGKGVEDIATKLKSFQKRYYWNVFLKGSILSLSIIIGYYLIVALLEYTLWLQTWIRFLIFFSFLGVVLYSIVRFLTEPLKYWVIKKGIGDEESARIIGHKLPDVKDRLVNLLQLQSKVSESSLASASILQRSNELGPLNFESTINYAENTRFLKYLIIPIVVAAFIFLFDSKILVGSTDRIIHFTKSYTPQAPFAFNIDTKSLVAYYNEDFTLDVNISGEAIPQDLYILLNQSQRFKLQANGSNSFSFVFENIQESVDFNLEGAGFFSENYRIDVMHRPELNSLSIELDYPPYIHKSRSISNSGNLEIPEGTSVNWKLTTSFADSASIIFQNEKKEFYLSISDNQVFNYEKRVVEDDQYDLLLRNKVSQNKDKISYTVRVIKDQYPKIALSNFTDSVLYKQIVLGGMINDDYGITQLDLIYSVTDDRKKEVKSNRISIPINKSQFQQSFFYNWSLDSIELKAGYQLDYYLKVWDNDGVNGRKSSRTASYNFYLPSDDQLVADINKSSEQTQQKIDESVSNAAKLQDKIEQANQRLKGKQSLDWQDKKMLEEIITQKNNLEKLINEFKEENKLLNEKKDAFSDQDEKIKEKAEQIQKLMDELLDDETKKLFEELQKLLKENSDAAQMQKLLDKLDKNTDNLEKELDRMLEIYKQLKFETMYDQAENLLKQQIENQKELLEKTEQAEKNNDKKENNSEQSKDQSNSENQELAKEQEKLKEESEQLKEQLKELDKLGEEIDDNTEVPDESEMEDIMNDQEDSQEMLEQNSPSKSKQKQQNALQKMQQMKDKMESSQNSMSMEMDMENIEALRQIIHGLIKLSYDQESLMKRFGELQSGDPQINTLAETQLQVKDNAKVLEDSLLALAKRDPFMGSFITREISELNEHLDKVNDANRERRKPQAQTEMQASMTSFNNLALMLDSHYDMLMQMMANAKPSMKGKGKKKGDNPGLSQLQQQLNQKIEQLKNSGKSGRELSEELAKMAAEQERIRRAIQEMQDKMKEGGKMPGGDLPSKMEQTEMDLVNKQLTDQLIKRQQDILTRLLETEKSMREQDQDEERKGETAKEYEKEVPKAFEEYLRLKEKEVELLKTVPPKLYPYYKKEVDEYFKRIGNP